MHRQRPRQCSTRTGCFVMALRAEVVVVSHVTRMPGWRTNVCRSCVCKDTDDAGGTGMREVRGNRRGGGVKERLRRWMARRCGEGRVTECEPSTECESAGVDAAGAESGAGAGAYAGGDGG